MKLYSRKDYGMVEDVSGDYVYASEYSSLQDAYNQVKSERDELVALLREIIEMGHEESEGNDGLYRCCESCAACKAKKYLSEHKL
jgi:hypothetical protein